MQSSGEVIDMDNLENATSEETNKIGLPVRLSARSGLRIVMGYVHSPTVSTYLPEDQQSILPDSNGSCTAAQARVRYLIRSLAKQIEN